MTAKTFIYYTFVIGFVCSCAEDVDKDPRTDEALGQDEGTVLGVTEDDLATAIFLDTSEALIDTAMAYINSGERIEEGVALFQKMIDSDPSNPKPHWFLASFFLENYTKSRDIRDVEDAILHLEKVHELDPDWGEMVYYLFAQAYYYQGEFEKAIDNLETFKENTESPDNIILAETRIVEIRNIIEAQNLQPTTEL